MTTRYIRHTRTLAEQREVLASRYEEQAKRYPTMQQDIPKALYIKVNETHRTYYTEA